MQEPTASTNRSALAGVRVLDLTHHISGPYCTRLLADYGADVIKVERPGTGDASRAMGPFHKDDPHPDKSGLYLHLNTNKRGITLDLKCAAGRRALLQLVSESHILVESFAPRVMPSLGLSYETLDKVNRGLVMTSISNFGQNGPYRDFKTSEIVTYGMAGPMYATGMPEREPIKLGGNVIQYQVGASAATATMTALLEAERAGVGDHVDISLMRAQASSIDRRTTMLVGYQYTGEVNTRRNAGSLPGVGVRPVSDGYIAMNADGGRFALLARMIGQADLVHDPRFADIGSRSEAGRSEEFDEYFFPWLMDRNMSAAFEEMQANHIPAGPIYRTEDLLSDPHFRQRGYWATVAHPETGPVEQTGAPFRMTGTPWAVLRPAPKLGEHNESIFRGILGLSRPELAKLRSSGVI